jgi:hypothetical protein
MTLRVTVYDGNSEFSQVLPDLTLSPEGFRQISGVLVSNGLALANGYARVERINGSAPFYAYAVINDQANSDGSFIPPQTELAELARGLTLPVVVENGAYSSELIVANWSPQTKVIHFDFVSEGVQSPGQTASFSLSLAAGRQLIIPNLVQYLRDREIPGIGAQGTPYCGSVFATAEDGDCRALFLGARISSAGTRGRYGVLCTAIPYGQASTSSVWLFGLQQNHETRTNLALVNTGEVDSSPSVFAIDLFDGATAQRVRTIEGISLKARSWTQIGRILDHYAPSVMQGYACVRLTNGINPFITYGIINDGALPHERSGDGAFVPSSQALQP